MEKDTFPLSKSSRAIGIYGERIGVNYLKRTGYKILEANYKCKFGEIDVVTKCKGFLVFVEIKSRLQSVFGYPEESVDRKKQRKIIQVAEWYLKEKSLSDLHVRFDVLAISQDLNGKVKFRVIENAFEVPES